MIATREHIYAQALERAEALNADEDMDILKLAIEVKAIALVLSRYQAAARNNDDPMTAETLLDLGWTLEQTAEGMRRVY